MSTLVQASVKLLSFKTFFVHDESFKKQPLSFSPLACFPRRCLKLRANGERRCFSGEGGIFNNRVLLENRGWKSKRKKKRMVLVKNNQGFGFNGGGSDNGSTARLLANLALAIGLTYLSMTGQLGWILDAIVSIWIFAVLIPIVGLGAFLWWAGRDIMQGTLCPFCGQPFSVVGNEFVEDSVKFSNQSTTFSQAFNDFTQSRNGKDSSRAIDVEAEVKDAE